MNDLHEESKGSQGQTEATDVQIGRTVRWVQFAFIVIAATTFWLSSHVIFAVWNIVQEPSELGVRLGAIVVSALVSVGLYKKPSSKRFVLEVVAELQSVTWPQKKETWSSTIVVVITSLIASLILFGFDAAWSALTDLIYEV